MSRPIPINNNNKTPKRNRPQSSSWSLYGSSPGGSMYINGTPTNNVETHVRPFCNNCGKHDHYFRQCREPVTSMGIITFRINKSGEREYLMIRRKYTLGFIEFVMGHYSAYDPESIIILFKQMVQSELDLIETYYDDYEALWDILWNDNIVFNAKFRKEKEQAKYRFELIQQKDHIITLTYCIKNIKPLWEYPEWGFPKGRRNQKESSLEAGIREFEEETGYSRKELIINSTEEFVELFNGTNGILYRHIYYVAECFNLDDPVMDSGNRHQMNEIGDIQWFLFKEAVEYIRDHHVQKREVLKLVHSEY